MSPAVAPDPPYAGLAPLRGSNRLGALFMIGAAVSFTAMTLLVKFLGDDYSASLQTFFRQAAGLVVLAPLILRRGPAIFRTRRPWLLTVRSVGGILAMTLSFYAYQHLPLGQANALSFTRVLWMAPMSVIFLGERLSPARAAIAGVGFVGVLLMVGPLGGAIQPAGVGAALVASGLLALTIIGMKVVAREESATTLLVWSAALGVVLAFPGAAFSWRWPGPVDGLLLALMGVLGIITQSLYIRAIQLGDTLVMAPIDYIRLVFAAIAGFVFFGEIPTLAMLGGAALIVGSSLYMTFREQRSSGTAPRPILGPTDPGP